MWIPRYLWLRERTPEEWAARCEVSYQEQNEALRKLTLAVRAESEALEDLKNAIILGDRKLDSLFGSEDPPQEMLDALRFEEHPGATAAYRWLRERLRETGKEGQGEHL